jgi:tight adherence protein C
MIDGFALTAATLFLIALVAGLAAARRLLAREGIITRRLRSGPPPEEAQPAPPLLDRLAESLGPLARAAQPLNADELSRVRLQLTRAGIRAERALQIFFASRIILALVLALGFLWANSVRTHPLEPSVALAIGFFAAGYYLPSVWLSARTKARQLDLERGLPETLDLLVTCVEAGLGLDAALQRVARETTLAWPLLGEELELTFLEIKAGIPRMEGFRRLAHRTGLSELKSLAATLAQTQAFGTSIALALRVQAEGIRVRRTQHAEERAGYVSVKMALPLTLCILPTLFAVALGPAVIRISHALLPLVTRKP